jgi:hypothetical protein
VETKRGADALEDWLYTNGFPATSIHGDRTQQVQQSYGYMSIVVTVIFFGNKSASHHCTGYLNVLYKCFHTRGNIFNH